MNRSYFAYRIARELNSGIFIVEDSEDIEEFSSALEFFLSLFTRDGIVVSSFYPYEIAPESAIPPSEKIRRLRVRSLFDLAYSDRVFFVTDVLSLIQPVVKRDIVVKNRLTLKRGSSISRDVFIGRLSEMGYLRRDYVDSVSEFAVRGSIVDVFSPYYDKPVRIDFFDDTVDDVRLFLPSNQRTIRGLEEANIILPFEYGFKDDEFGYALMKERGHLIDFEEFRNMNVFSFVSSRDVDVAYRRVMFFEDKFGDLFIPSNRLDVFLKEAEKVDEFLPRGLFPEEAHLDEKVERIKSFSRDGCVVIACASPLREERVESFLAERGISFSRWPGSSPRRGVYLTDKYLRRGFADGGSGIAFVSFEDLFGRVIQRHGSHAEYKRKVFEVGSKVVHKKYGVGIYRGIKKLDIDGRLEELIEIDYRDSEKLYVPLDGLDQVFEYDGPAEIDSLSSRSFSRREAAVRRAVKKILSELVHAYAKRKLIKRRPYEIDSIFYSEFQASFEYEETPDQIKAIRDIESDMASDKPMDRLVCGDASFGKTEVAMRAAAISVFNGRQVVVMVPTTVLSFQHFRTFRERFENFPVNIALLNRFVGASERRSIIEGLRKGKVDILIATHSVYSDKIEFSDLGLVVVDEEQRFGVRIKEKLKSRYPYVDVLYMSATPIPRTLSMSLGGILDVSVIKTPPVSRKPIETFVMRRRPRVVRDAILRELARHGQVFFIHNRIEELDSVKSEINELLPGVKSEIVHARMPKRGIKGVFEDFERGKFDVLITTSIVESGLDFKNANTIIIDDAENFGLSDLYQLRGRVGRSDRVAYAYLLFRGELSDKARLRLSCVREFMDRGVGFSIALRDLEIRGSGNILGKDQSGNIKGMGVDTYMALMEEAISEIKREPVQREVEVHSRIEAYIPDEYIPREEKFFVYKSLSSARELDDVELFREEIEDKYGTLPREALNLIDIVSVKILARKAYVKRLFVSEREATLEFYVDANIDTERLVRETIKLDGKFVSESVVALKFDGNVLNGLRKFLQMVV